MAARVIWTEVKQIIGTSLTETDIEAYITAAHLMIDKLLSASAELTEAQLKEIERWLAAHFIACTRERQKFSERVIGDVEVTYVGKTGMGLDATFYGQQVKVLDTTGILAAQVGRQAAAIFAVPGPERGTHNIGGV